jgi:hypothetical protein
VFRVFGRPRFALLSPSSDGSRYNLFFEGAATPDALDRFENALRENPHYAHCRNLGQLQPIAFIPIASNASESFLRFQAANGIQFGDIKPSFLSAKAGWETAFEEPITPAVKA